MDQEIIETTRLNKRSKELVLVDFKVLLFLGIEQDTNDIWFECLSESNNIVRYSTYTSVVFLKDCLPEFNYKDMVKRWNLEKNSKAE